MNSQWKTNMNFWILNPKYRGLGAKPSAAGGNEGLRAETPVSGDFCSF